MPFATQGRANHPGALRSSKAVAPGGTSNLTEEASLFTLLSHINFFFVLSDVPLLIAFCTIVNPIPFRLQRLFHSAISATDFISFVAIQLVQWLHRRLLGHASEFVDLQIRNGDKVERICLHDRAPIRYVHYPCPHPTKESGLCDLSEGAGAGMLT